MIKYRKLKGYKYQVTAPYNVQTDIKGYDIKTPYYQLWMSGRLEIFTTYCWNGASGPTVDTEDTQEGSCVHDCIYQMIRSGELPYWYKSNADKLFHKLLIKNGMSRIRARYFYWGVKYFGSIALI